MRVQHGDLVIGLARASLVAAGVNPDRVAHVDYSPPQGHIGIHLSDGPFCEDDALAFCSPEWVKDAKCVNGFMDISLGSDVIRNWRGRPRPLEGTSVAVEHTSMTPVYPINVATGRGSVIGEQLRRVASLLGARAEGRFWVEQKARQTERIEMSRDAGPLAWHGKPDHVVWSIFRAAVAAHRRVAPIHFEDAFCHPSASDLFSPSETGYSRLAIEEVVSAYRDTLAQLGVRNISFDFEDDVLRQVDLRRWLADFIATGKFGDGDVFLAETSAPRPRYMLRSAVYYRYLFEHFDRVLSVVPISQMGFLSGAASAVLAVTNGPRDRLHLIYFGNVTDSGKLDHPTRGPFHSLDDLLRSGGRHTSATRHMMLSVRARTAIDLAQSARAVGTPRVRSIGEPQLEAILMLEDFAVKGLRFLRSGNYADLLVWQQRARHLVRANGAQSDTPLWDLSRVLTLLG